MALDFWAQRERTALRKNSIPEHVAIIMDGNGRWAKQRGLPRLAGHAEGLHALERVVKEAVALHIKYLSVYAFSTENWKRPQEEITGLMKLFFKAMDEAVTKLIKNDIRIMFLGDLSRFPAEMKKVMDETMRSSAKNNRLTLNIMINYGSRQELTTAVNKLLSSGKKEVSEDDISKALYTGDIPDPDLLIRTSGELRISNFLLWQSAYTEFWVTKKFWPDFNSILLRQAVNDFQKRHRRKGGL